MDETEKKRWTIVFLGVTLLAIFLELFASFDKNPSTIPWTNYIVTYIPAWIGLPIIILFAIWLVIHFIRKYDSNASK